MAHIVCGYLLTPPVIESDIPFLLLLHFKYETLKPYLLSLGTKDARSELRSTSSSTQQKVYRKLNNSLNPLSVRWNSQQVVEHFSLILHTNPIVISPENEK